MQEQLNLKPAHKLVKSYYETLNEYGQRNFDHEMAVRSAFQALLHLRRRRLQSPREHHRLGAQRVPHPLLRPNITKWDIFHYVYAVLHHPEYRQRYAANLKRELPRIPFVGAPPLSPAVGDRVGITDQQAPSEAGAKSQPVNTGLVSGHDFSRAEKTASSDVRAGLQPGGTGGSPGLQAGDKERAEGASALPKAGAQPQAERPKEIFRAFADAGKRLADLHVNYEQQPESPLQRVEKGQLDWRVEKMRLSKDKTSLVYNEFLTLKGIPPETYEYRLGNRSALEWVIDRYQVSTDKRSGITNDPNRADDPEYILRLIGQVITVSLETIKIVKSLPALETGTLVAGD